MQDRSPNVQYMVLPFVLRGTSAHTHRTMWLERKHGTLPSTTSTSDYSRYIKHKMILVCRQFKVIVFRPNNTALSEPRPLQRAASVQSLYLSRSQSECTGDMYVLLSVSGAVYAYICEQRGTFTRCSL